MSKTKTILFRADSSSSIGTGHIMRDLVLAKKYEDSTIIFVTQNLEGNINAKIEEAGYTLEILKSNNLDEFDSVVKQYKADMVVIDHYEIDKKFEKQLKKQNPQITLMVFDDTYEKHYCDILLNHNIYADEKKYKDLVPKNCELQCGKRYTLLRDEFVQVKKQKTIFIAMGGADSANLNIKILKVLKKFQNIQNIKVNLVTTSANPNLTQLQKYVQDKRWIKLHINSTKLAKLMKESDFAIVTPSVTLNEVDFIQLHFIAIQTASNQKYMAEYLFSNNEMILEEFDKAKLSFFIQLQLQKIVLKNFITLSSLEKKIVHSFRNDKRIREWMYNKDKIPYRVHFDYIESLKQRDDKIYFLVQHECTYIGVVDFTNISQNKKVAELGIYANPDLKAQGNILMQTIIEYGFRFLMLERIKANVYKKNISAINLYKRFGFVVKKKEQDMLYMELKR